MLSIIYSFKLYMCQDPRIARAYTAQNTRNKPHISLVSLSVYPRSCRGAERIRQGEGRLSRPPQTALERSYLTENSSSENRILRPRRKKTLPESPERRMIIPGTHLYCYCTAIILLVRILLLCCNYTAIVLRLQYKAQ